MDVRRLALIAIVAASCSDKDNAPSSAGTEVVVAPAAKKRDAAPPTPTTPTTPTDIVSSDEDGARIELSLLGRYRDPAFAASGLPGVSASGAKVAYGEELLDGGRGNPNFRLVVRDASDRPIVIKEILSPERRFTADDEPVVRGRIDEANRFLAEETWRPMKAFTASDLTTSGAATMQSGDFSLGIKGNVLELSRGSKAVLRRPLARLLKVNAACPGRPLVSEAAIGHGRLLVRFHFETDGCDREQESHVLALSL